MVWIYFSVPASFYRQGLTLVSRCFQLTGAWFPAAETPHTGVRPWKQGHRLTEKEMRSIDLPGHLCDPPGPGPAIGLTQFQPGTPGGSLGGNALSGFWFLLPAQKKPPA